jgi:hypothetical protein
VRLKTRAAPVSPSSMLSLIPKMLAKDDVVDDLLFSGSVSGFSFRL